MRLPITINGTDRSAGVPACACAGRFQAVNRSERPAGSCAAGASSASPAADEKARRTSAWLESGRNAVNGTDRSADISARARACRFRAAHRRERPAGSRAACPAADEKAQRTSAWNESGRNELLR